MPQHHSRERQRGFNQTALLGRWYVAVASVSSRRDILRRTRRTTLQVRTDGAAARRDNVAGAFAVCGRVAGRTVLVIDDVCTTGATLRVCAEPLRHAGAARVSGLTFARES